MQAVSPMTPSKRVQNDIYDDIYPSHPINLFNPDFPPVPSSHVKRLKLDSVSTKDELISSVATGPPQDGSLITPAPTPTMHLPLIPALYHLAVSAHHASALHLQQTFIPGSIGVRLDSECAPITASMPIHGSVRYKPDPQALVKALSLLLLSLDLLRTGRMSKDLSESEEVAFGLEFGLVAVKVAEVQAMRVGEKGKQAEKIDMETLKYDARDAVSNALSHARRHKYLKDSMQKLELLDARLFFLEKRDKAGRRSCRQALFTTSNYEFAQRYSLYMLLLDNVAETESTEAFHILEEFHSEALQNAHQSVLQLIHLIRLRLLFLHRRWADLPAAIEAFGQEISTLQRTSSDFDVNTDVWHSHLQLHYILYRALWHGRAGDDVAAKGLLKQVYVFVDQIADSGLFKPLRRNGGLLRVDITPGHYLNVQVTPPNVTYIMTYLVSSVSRRDYLGSAGSCKSVVLPRIMREHAVVARADDAWDLNFSVLQGPAHALKAQQEVMTVRIEVMLEEVTALGFRGNGATAEQIFKAALDLAREQNVFNALAPHFCLVHAQLSHLLGRDGCALRAYRACSALLVPGSELGLLVEICTLACEGSLVNLLDNAKMAEHVKNLVERCRSSSNASLAGAGQFLWSFLEANRVASKRKLSAAYEISQRANNNILRCLIFAFTTSVHLYGAIDKTLRQLEAGRDLARLFGGKDRPDGVGQLALGLWFAEKLKEYHRREGNAEEYAKAKWSQKQHLIRLAEQKDEVASIPCNNISSDH